ncbi:hypothetical protein GCM10029964_020390 [Kibdelosporangium lantanae]
MIGRSGRRLLALMLSSRDHDGDRGWLDLGSGAWDRDGRESYIRLDRMYELDEDDLRREGAILAPDAFERVSVALNSRLG